MMYFKLLSGFSVCGCYYHLRKKTESSRSLAHIICLMLPNMIDCLQLLVFPMEAVLYVDVSILGIIQTHSNVQQWLPPCHGQILRHL